MKAIVYTKYGSPEMLHAAELAKPVPKENEVLVKVYAASVNSWDWDMLKGHSLIIRLLSGLFKPKHTVLGADIAGVIESAGKKVTAFQPGDEVFGDIAGSGFGGFAEYVCVPEKLLAKKSPAMSFAQAAALPQAGLLALQGLRYKGSMKAGDKVLINGAGGGVGTLALQYARQCGAVVTCVDRPEKFNMLRSLGADHLVDYTKEDYTKNGRQYDRILDVIAHRTISDYKRALKPGGVFAMIGGSMGALLFQLMFFSSLHSLSSNKTVGLMGYRPNRKDLDELTLLFEEDKVIPVIDKYYPLNKTADAFRYFATGQVQGKIIINVAVSE